MNVMKNVILDEINNNHIDTDKRSVMTNYLKKVKKFVHRNINLLQRTFVGLTRIKRKIGLEYYNQNLTLPIK